jgi:hypothetical protein
VAARANAGDSDVAEDTGSTLVVLVLGVDSSATCGAGGALAAIVGAAGGTVAPGGGLWGALPTGATGTSRCGKKSSGSRYPFGSSLRRTPRWT